LWNSIVAGNTAQAQGQDIYGPISSLGYNLIGAVDATNGNTWLANDQTGTVANPLNPGLDPLGLQDNGGPTNTIRVLNTSPAYRRGDPGLQDLPLDDARRTDQRGLTRNGMVDMNQVVTIGAYDPDAS
jgi:hypothetical protein